MNAKCQAQLPQGNQKSMRVDGLFRSSRLIEKSFRSGVFQAAASICARLVLPFTVLLFCVVAPATAQQEYLLGTGDILKISVFQNPDLATEARVSELGAISFPLVGSVQVRGLTLPGAEKKISQMLKDGGFVLKPQVNALLVQAVSNQVAVLGQVNRPGRYSIEASGGKLSGMLSAAGGINTATGGDIVTVSGMRDGKPFRKEIDVVKTFEDGSVLDDIELSGGDILYIGRASVFYIYGQVGHSGAFRLERGMTVMQTLAAGGGITAKGTTRGVVIHRRDATGKVKELATSLDDPVQEDDVIFVKESLF